MNTPVIKEPTKKKFHFPKSAAQPAAEAEKQEKQPAKASKAAAPAKKATAKKAAAKPAEARKTKKADAAPKKTEAAPAVAEEKARRAKKEKVVRDSFTMPKSDYEKIDELKKRCVAAGISVKKSELLRAGLHMLAFAPEKRLIAAVSALEPVKTGRPAKS
ncbi:hypothetical protein FAZ69_32075 [Trinickia terrae]|uniref:Uncharacterized protein n=1 Tax=Trinickia terrae TaxID=2571161 RepID=A0A4U1HFM7_9BURK|nr:hypothetical protein [Trinickia terrae]TKC78227.1 hypothetical protein FAZ69_32075 [Trinickia terrae]